MSDVPTILPAAIDTSDLSPALETIGWFAGAVVVALGVAWLAGTLLRVLARRWSLATELHRRSRYPVRVVLVLLALWITLRLVTEPSSWTPGVEQALTILLIAAVAWLLIQVMRLVETAVKARWTPDEGEDSRYAGRVRTQIQVLRQILEALVVVVAVAVALLTFPGMRAVGASLLASAGLLSIVAGIAAQTSLANVFAGLQIAFSDSIRLDDVVVVEGEWGRVEEITLTYVVVHLWDDRRLILPSTYFTTTVFQNWTRRDAHLLGTVELDVDWTVPLEGMRAEMRRLLGATDLWDRRVNVLQVTDATGGFVRVRVLASAVDAPTLFDLRCYLREGLVTWLREQSEAGLPRTRHETIDPEVWEAVLAAQASGPTRTAARPTGSPEPPTVVAGGAGGEPAAAQERTEVRTGSLPDDAAAARLFTGTLDAVGRSLPFTSPPRGAGGTRTSGVTALPAPEPPARGPAAEVPVGAPASTPRADPGAIERVPRAVRVSELPQFPPPSRSPRPGRIPPDDDAPGGGEDAPA